MLREVRRRKGKSESQHGREIGDGRGCNCLCLFMLKVVNKNAVFSYTCVNQGLKDEVLKFEYHKVRVFFYHFFFPFSDI